MLVELHRGVVGPIYLPLSGTSSVSSFCSLANLFSKEYPLPIIVAKRVQGVLDGPRKRPRPPCETRVSRGRLQGRWGSLNALGGTLGTRLVRSRVRAVWKLI